jgi:tetratricopeptide (TPR) repeat protein
MFVTIDRDTAIRRAEKLLRDGRLDAAIAEYQALVDDQPTDWNAANALGDLLVRAGRVDKAVMQFARIADHLAREGFLPKAAALYKKILKIKPDEDEAALRAADVSLRQGLVAAAKGYLGQAIDRRHARGDRRGAAELMVRLGALDPGDANARVVAARALGQAGDGRGAANELRAIAIEFMDQRGEAEGLALLREAAGFDPLNDEIRGHLVRAALRLRDLQGVLTYARTTAHLKDAAMALQASGDFTSSIPVLERIIDVDPADGEAPALLARACARQGDLRSAREYLGRGTNVSASVESELARAEVELVTGALNDGRATLCALLARTPDARPRVVELALELGQRLPDAAFHCVEAVVSLDIEREEWPRASEALTRVIERSPGHVPALMRLVEVCVDGGLGAAALERARGRLADAYLASGRGLEARLLAEDLVCSAPWDRAHVNRLRSALVMLGERDPDRVIVDRMAGTPGGRHVRRDPAAAAPAGAGADRDSESVEAFELDPHATDVGAVLREVEEGEFGAEVELVEIDLSRVIDEGDEAVRSAKGAAMSSDGPRDLEGVFEDFRQEVSRESAMEEAEQQYTLALTYRDMGLIDEAIRSLERAARSPRRRFTAAALLARLHLSRNRFGPAIEWFERAAEAPAPTVEESRALLYELGTTLERTGEVSRALAVYLELRSDADDYRDVVQRIVRLSDVQAKG